MDKYIKEVGGAGDWGTDKATTKYKDDTPGQQTKRKRNMKSFRSVLEKVAVEEAMEMWTVTVQKPMNKLKKGDKQTVKARSAFEAVNKAMKLWKDPSLKAAPANAFKITKEDVAAPAEIEESDLAEFGSRNMSAAQKANLRRSIKNRQKGRKEDVDLDEGKMKEFHAMVKKGMTAEQISKKIGIDVKLVKDFMKDMVEEVVSETPEKMKSFSNYNKV